LKKQLGSHSTYQRIGRLDAMRIQLARPDALLPLSLLGLLTGLLAGSVIVLFRILVESSQDFILPGQGSDNYEALPEWANFALPIAGAILLGLLFRFAGKGVHVLGVARVMERMTYHQGHFTLRGFVLQFVGAAIALISGQSVGREGPHVFLGAAAGSLMGQYFSLPNNTIRTFVGCGTAAGIAASFNTPLAGVIFALEVVLMEYTVASFIPVILAAVVATTVSNLVLGSTASFIVPVMKMGSLSDLLLVIILGIVAGTVSALFIHLLQHFTRSSKNIPIWWRLLLAGVLMGLSGMLIPQLMGIGYDTVEQALNGHLAIGLLLLLVVSKLLATSIVIGLGVPGGMIGPTLFIGAMLGAATAKIFLLLPFDLHTEAGFFALLGMGAMMSASLQAPLAALVAMLELTDNPAVILPGMLAVVVSGVTASELFRKQSLFLSILKASGEDYNTNPILQSLRRVGVGSVMEQNFIHVDNSISIKLALEVLRNKPSFILIDKDNIPVTLMPAVELAKYIETRSEDGPDSIDLLEIPALRWQVGSVHLQANLQEAYEILQSGTYEALFVERSMRKGEHHIFGVLSKNMVEKAYSF
jgi:chloride channel protein, CIC family